MIVSLNFDGVTYIKCLGCDILYGLVSKIKESDNPNSRFQDRADVVHVQGEEGMSKLMVLLQQSW